MPLKALRLFELHELVQSAEFQAWWRQLVDARALLAQAQAKHEELLGQHALTEFRAELTQKQAIDALYRAGEKEDDAARLWVEAEALENKALAEVAAFEEQRFRASELWYRQGAAEREVELSHGKSPQGVVQAGKRLAGVKADYERETARKNALWSGVESLWAKSLEVGLMTSEAKLLAKKVRREAEQGFQLSEERRGRATALKAEVDQAATAVEQAQAKVALVLRAADARFGASVGSDFLFFRHRDDRGQAYAVALVDDRDAYNLELRPLAVYSVDRKRGVGLLTPARAEVPSVEEGDRRFDAYFLTGRKGQRPARAVAQGEA